jgi:glycosyltransferase involved in cell wall biosynthesis
MTSVIIAAHNEAPVVGRCLDALLSGAPAGTDIIVVANGCTDDTAAVARARRGTRVIELAVASKPAALNAGDAAAASFPRVYLDADITLTGVALGRLTAAVAPGNALAAAPRRRLILAGRSLLVRAYFAVHSRLPLFAGTIFGRGVIALSEAGRSRFDHFPDIVADDLFLDSLFTAAEKCEVHGVYADIITPRRTSDLVRRLTRVRAGNAALRARSGAVRPAARLSWLRGVVLPRPWLAPAAVCYIGLTVAAASLARWRPSGWGRDQSSRVDR